MDAEVPEQAETGSDGGLADLLVDLGKVARESSATLADGIGEAEDAVRDGLQQAEENIRTHPLLAIGIAAGLGFVLGLLLRGSGQNDGD